jgi:dimethylhistidine N-methyltransferase
VSAALALDLDAPDALDAFRDDVVRGLSARPKRIPGRWRWDARGTQLLDRLADVPEHYPLRAEREILVRHGADVARAIGPRARIVEVGPIDPARSGILLRRLETPARYVPIEMELAAAQRAEAELRVEVPGLSLEPAVADVARAFPELRWCLDAARTVVVLLGWSLGQHAPHRAAALLSRAALLAGSGGSVLVGTDMKKPRRMIEAAHDDPGGVSAAIDRNLLVRINRELGATFDVTRFAHRASWDPIRGRVEMRLVSTSAQRVRVRDRAFHLDAGEWIVTGHRYAYDLAEVEQLARRAGLEPIRAWTDPRRRVALHELRVD